MIFKLDSNHHKMSCMLRRSVLGVQGANFWPKITFPATSDRILINFVKHQNFEKIAKIVTNFFLYPPPSFFTLFLRTSMKHKIITRGRKNILKPDFESSRRELSFMKIASTKFNCLFVTQTV